MSIETYTSYDEIRALLGVTPEELDDVTLGLPVYGFALQQQLEAINVDLPTEFSSVAAIDEASRTANQQRFYAYVKLFAPYCVAVQLDSGIGMFAPKTITDGKASVSRDSGATFKVTIEKCREWCENYRDALTTAYAALVSVSVTKVSRPFMVVSTPTPDPVTGS